MEQPASPASPPDPVTDYRLSPAFALRLFGLGLVLLAVVALVASVASVVWSWSPDVVVLVVVVGLLLVLGVAGWLRTRAYVVRLTETGYRVRFVRGVGVAEGRWDEVGEASAAHPHDVPCVVLERHDGTSTSIPVEVLAADRDRFADDVRARLERAGRRRG